MKQTAQRADRLSHRPARQVRAFWNDEETQHFSVPPGVLGGSEGVAFFAAERGERQRMTG